MAFIYLYVADRKGLAQHGLSLFISIGQPGLEGGGLWRLGLDSGS